MRIVSLLPSATEILAAVGGAKLLVGRSHECDWPPSVLAVPAVTGQRTATSGSATTSAEIDRHVRATLSGGGAASLYTLDVDLLRTLRPDVILTQDLCDACSIDLGTVRRAAAGLDPAPRIVSLDPRSVEDVLDDVLRVGAAVGLEAEAEAALVALRERYWTAVDYVNPYVDGPAVALLEWMDPLFVGGHWTPQLVEAAGGRHPLNPPGRPSRQVDPDALVDSAPEYLVVCPCGLDLAAIERELDVLTGAAWWPRLPAVRNGRVTLVDGSQMFNRPGPRLVEAFRWLVGWMNDRPELIEEGFPWKQA